MAHALAAAGLALFALLAATAAAAGAADDMAGEAPAAPGTEGTGSSGASPGSPAAGAKADGPEPHLCPGVAELLERKWTDEDVPYLDAGMPLAYVQALAHAGREISFSEFAAASGWAFSFGYSYDDLSTAFLAICGQPGRDGPCEGFPWLIERLGYGYEGVKVKDTEAFVAFVRRHVDAGHPILSEHFDGGLIWGYRERGGKVELRFDGTVGSGWVRPEDVHPVWVYVLRRTGAAMDRKQLYRQALARALRRASRGSLDGVPQGLAALEAYRDDVADPAKDFDGGDRGCWFCWATFERLSARACCAEWLRSAAELLGDPARPHLLAAATHYGRAFEAYESFREASGAGTETEASLQDRARTPARIAVLLPLLDAAIAEERSGIADLRQALLALGLPADVDP